NLAMNSARRVLGQGEPSDAALARLQSLILDELRQPLLLYGLKGERALMAELTRRIAAGEVPISALSDSGPKSAADLRGSAIAPWGKLLFDNQQAVSIEWTTAAIAIARHPAASRPPLWKAWEDRRERVRRTEFGPYLNTFP